MIKSKCIKCESLDELAQNGRDFLEMICKFVVDDINNGDNYPHSSDASYTIMSMKNAVINYKSDIDNKYHIVKCVFNPNTLSIDCKVDRSPYTISIQDIPESIFSYDEYLKNGLIFDEMSYDSLVDEIERNGMNEQEIENNFIPDSEFDGVF